MRTGLGLRTPDGDQETARIMNCWRQDKSRAASSGRFLWLGLLNTKARALCVCVRACVHFARFCVFALVFPSSVFACLFFFAVSLSLSLSFVGFFLVPSSFLPDLKIKCRPPPITIFPVAWSFAKEFAFVWNHPFLVTCVLVLIVFFLFCFIFIFGCVDDFLPSIPLISGCGSSSVFFSMARVLARVFRRWF